MFYKGGQGLQEGMSPWFLTPSPAGKAMTREGHKSSPLRHRAQGRDSSAQIQEVILEPITLPAKLSPPCDSFNGKFDEQMIYIHGSFFHQPLFG